MNEFEQKAEELRKDAAEAKAQAEAAKKTAEEMKGALNKANETIEEQKKAIDNLDKSVKEQQSRIEAMTKKEEEKMDFKAIVLKHLEAHKEELQKVFSSKSGRCVIQFKADSPVINPVMSLSVMRDPNVYSARFTPNAFLDNLPKEQQAADRLSWIEGTYTSNVNYVDVLTKVATDDTAAAKEMQRQFGKLGSRLLISSENQNWYQNIVNWAKDEGIRNICSKVDGEIVNGAGDDSSAPKKIYGLKTKGSTAFSALGKYEAPTVGDVILDASMQAAKNGYSTDVAFVSYKTFAELRGIKDKNGNPIYSEITGMIGAVRIIPSSKLADAEAYIIDSRVVKVIEKGAYEMELERLAELDGFAFYLRGHYQVKVSEPDKKGVIYVADIAAAITAITAAAA